MGKLNCDPHIQHFSHEHPLEVCNFQPPQQRPTKKNSTCAACKQKLSSELVYTCRSCSFILHISCSQMLKIINHPSDPNHPLILLPKPDYPGGVFNCDACGRQKNKGFSYHCTSCSLDIHVQCASKPLSVNHPSHLHPLYLCFKPPYETNGFSCDICHTLGSNHWLYRCGQCGYDAHLSCATTDGSSQSSYLPQAQQQQQPQQILQQPQQFQFIPQQQQQVQPRQLQFMPQQILQQPQQFQFIPQQQQQVQPRQLQFMPQQHQQVQPRQLQFMPQQQQQVHPRQLQFMPPQQQQLQPQQMLQQPHQMQFVQQQPQPVPMLQHQYSFPGANNQPQFTTQGAVYQGVPVVNDPSQQQQQQLYHVNSAPSDSFAQMGGQPQAYNQQQVQDNITDTFVQGFVDGAAQQLGQNFVEGINGGGEDDESSSISYLDEGNSVAAILIRAKGRAACLDLI